MENNTSPTVQEIFSNTPTASHWSKIGFQKRAGVAVPLFSIYSQKSQGIGDFTDLRLLVDWCGLCGLSIIQLLPINDVGFNFRPYDAVSMFALDPMFLSLFELKAIDTALYQKDIQALQAKFPLGSLKVNYKIKGAKLELLWKMFGKQAWHQQPEFQHFLKQNHFWIHNYALFKIIKQYQDDCNWEAWDDGLRRREAEFLEAFQHAHAKEVEFQMWLQWQAAEQLQAAKKYANDHGVWLLGDIPFLVSRDSADVWAHQNYFKLDLASGAPPDGYSAIGQRWGMPPYHWENIAAQEYDYIIHKMKYAERFFDLFRIDHFVGVFRIWTISLQEPLENGGLHGRFDPAEEWTWEEHGRKLVEVMLNATAMLPCAEDLGVIPACSYKIIDKYGILGMDIQRWNRDWDHTFAFKQPEAYRVNSIAVISTHDMSSFQTWWEYEAGTVDEEFFQRKCETRGFDFGWLKAQVFTEDKLAKGRLRWKAEIDSVDRFVSVLQRAYDEVKDFIEIYNGTFSEQAQFWDYLGLPQPWKKTFSKKMAQAALTAINSSSSMFSIQLLQDWLCMSPVFKSIDFMTYRINCPGTVNCENWTLMMPFSLEQLLEFPENKVIKKIVHSTGRV